jgi:hypothetical protein
MSEKNDGRSSKFKEKINSAPYMIERKSNLIVSTNFSQEDDFLALGTVKGEVS